jgi:hypothetical protein
MSLDKAEAIAEMMRKKPQNKKKHFPLKLTVQVPNREEPLVIEDQCSLKIKLLK